jgi:hypothetical protein
MKEAADQATGWSATEKDWRDIAIKVRKGLKEAAPKVRYNDAEQALMFTEACSEALRLEMNAQTYDQDLAIFASRLDRLDTWQDNE